MRRGGDRMKNLKVMALILCIVISRSVAYGVDYYSADIKPNGIGGGGGLFSPSISPFDPNFMLVASDMRGVFRSVDGGKSWMMVHVDEFQDASSSTAPAYFRDRLYWYSGIYSPYVSFDKGMTWKPVKWPWQPRRKIVGMTAFSKGVEILFIATDQDLWRLDLASNSWSMVLNGKCLPPVVAGSSILAVSDNKLMESDDLGMTWKSVRSSVLEKGTVLDLAASTDRNDSLVLASIDNQGIARSVDQGRSWQFVEKFDNQRFLQIPEGQVKVAWAAEKKEDRGFGTRVWRSADGGQNWHQVFHFTGTRKNVEHSWVEKDMRWGYFITKTGFFASRTDADTAVMTTQGDMYLTRDGGGGWHSIINRDMGVLPDGTTARYQSIGLEVTTCFQYLFDPWEPDRHYVAFTDIGFIRSLDAGKTWSQGVKGSPWMNTFYRIRFDPDIPGRLYAGAANRHDIPDWSQLAASSSRYNTGGVVVSSDHGATWKPMGEGFPAAPCTDVIVAHENSSGKKIYVATAYGKGIYISRDGGKTWVETTNNISRDNLNFLRLWQNPKSGELYCLVTAFRDSGNVMTPGALWRSDNNGASWTNLTSQTPVIWPTAFQVDSIDQNIIYMTVASIPAKQPQQGGVWKTIDGGHSWGRVLEDNKFVRNPYDRMMAVAIHPKDRNLIYAGGLINGPWYSRNAGGTWQRYEVFPFRSVQGFDFDPKDPSKMIVTTFGGGFFSMPSIPKP